MKLSAIVFLRTAGADALVSGTVDPEYGTRIDAVQFIDDGTQVRGAELADGDLMDAVSALEDVHRELSCGKADWSGDAAESLELALTVGGAL